MPMSELEANLATTSLQERTYLGEQLQLKKDLLGVLEDESLPPLAEAKFRDALKIIQSNIQRIQTQGLL